MAKTKVKIGIMAPGSAIAPEIAEKAAGLAAALYPGGKVELRFHPQCFLRAGHFAGSDAERRAAFLELANDPGLDALWFARGGYGSCRLTEELFDHLEPAAAVKRYLGYSDCGTLLAGLYKQGFAKLAHGPMPVDVIRPGGEAAFARGLAYLVEDEAEGLEPHSGAGIKTAAFNIAILAQILGTPLQPDLSGHVLMLEEVSEYLYRIDRFLFQITSNPALRALAGIRLGRCSDIPENDPDFAMTETEVAEHWCRVSGIPYLGRADIGHDSDNKIVPFGDPAAATV
jgi:muramoyltetrapeptide carboxypeptidase